MLNEIWGSLIQALTSFTPEAFLKISHFGQQHPNFFLFAPLWWERAWNPNTIITYVDHSELYEYYQHPDQRSGTPARCARGWDSAVSSMLVLGRVGKLCKPISSGNLKPCWQDADDPGLWLCSTPAQRTFCTTLILQRRFYSPESLWRNYYASLAWWSRILTSSSGIPPLINFNMK